LRGLRSDLIDPAIAAHHGRIVKRTGDGSIVEFRSVVDAVRCAIEVQNGLAERNAGVSPERRIDFRVGIHIGDVVEEADGDLASTSRGVRRPDQIQLLAGLSRPEEGGACAAVEGGAPASCRQGPTHHLYHGLFAARVGDSGFELLSNLERETAYRDCLKPKRPSSAVTSSRGGLKKALSGRPVAIGLRLSNDPQLLAASDKLACPGTHSELLAECAILVRNRLLNSVRRRRPHCRAQDEDRVQAARRQHRGSWPISGSPAGEAVDDAREACLDFGHCSSLPLHSPLRASSRGLTRRLTLQ
jgi:hypothetical protein